MPTYQYACTEAECGHVFEQFQSFTEDSLTVCPQCDGRLRKVFNAVGVVFKGSGFYRTDSRSKADAGTEKSAGSGESSGSGSGSTSGTATKGSGGNGSSGGAGKPGTSSTGGSSSTATAGAGAA